MACNFVIRWIEVDPVDSNIQSFENLGPIRNRFLTIKWFKHAIRGHTRIV